jgi:hypothetical protein
LGVFLTDFHLVESFLKKREKGVLEFKASLITVKLEKEMQIVSLKIIKNIQPISVGV